MTVTIRSGRVLVLEHHTHELTLRLIFATPLFFPEPVVPSSFNISASPHLELCRLKAERGLEMSAIILVGSGDSVPTVESGDGVNADPV
jgi:hypothetical protein